MKKNFYELLLIGMTAGWIAQGMTTSFGAYLLAVLIISTMLELMLLMLKFRGRW